MRRFQPYGRSDVPERPPTLRPGGGGWAPAPPIDRLDRSAGQTGCQDDACGGDAATAHLPGGRSLANSGAILGWPQARRDWGRPGILLYGADPMPDEGHGHLFVFRVFDRVSYALILEAQTAVRPGDRFTQP